MKILPEQLVIQPLALKPPTRSGTEIAPRSSARPAVTPSGKEVSTATVNIAAPMGGRQSDVTFRRDPNGRVYYVVSDAQSGKEIQQLPPQAVRNVGQGIDEYLKKQEAKATPHVDVKA